MTVDYLIVGQGICGTMLSWFLAKEGRSFCILDEEREQTASGIAAGIINPVTGRRYVTTWMIEDLMPFAIDTYEQAGSAIGLDLVQTKNTIDFFTSVQMREAFLKRITEDDSYVKTFPDQNQFNPHFNYEFGCGEIKPCYTINISEMVIQWRKKLHDSGSFRAHSFNGSNLIVEKDHVRYDDITAQKIIFCNGTDTMKEPWFNLLPFAPNKGEALVIECKGLNDEFIFKRGMMLAPLPTKDHYWLGSNYHWEYPDLLPTENFLVQSKTLLDKWLKLPYRVISHKAALRPATLERRPFVGFHPLYPSVGILNGMGSKGTSLAPWFANQLVQQMVHGLPISPEASIDRFSRILSK
jgi:glycine/D-amino acid oxidase-like deaminating enzyme